VEVAVLGATGGRGRRVVRDLLERPEVHRVVLVGIADADLDGVVIDAHRNRAVAAAVPLSVAGISSALHGIDVVLCCLDAGDDPVGAARGELTAFEAARAAKVAYVTACEERDSIRAMRSQAPPAGGGPPLVLGMSWSPGLSNLLVAMGAERFDHVEAVRIAWCTPRSDRGDDGLGRLVRTWAGEAEVIEAGDVRGRRPGSSGETVFFPEPVGWQRVHVVRGAEVDTLPTTLGRLESLTVKGGIGGVPAKVLAQMVVRPPLLASPEGLLEGAGDPLRMGPEDRSGEASGATNAALATRTRDARTRDARTRDAKAPGRGGSRIGVHARFGVLTRGVASGLTPSEPRAAGWSSLRVDVTGRAGTQTRTVTFGIVDRLANLESAPMLVAALLVGGGEVHAHGVVAPEVAFAPARFLAMLGERGVRVATLER
jgi:hypothetical protein